MGEAANAIAKVFHENEELFYKISQVIWSNPELCFKEFCAHKLLTDHLEKLGFYTIRNYILETGFKAQFTNNRSGPTVAIICEYDALPELGHACGHNLIAEAGFAAAVAVKAALEADASLGGTVVVLGTPAEEGGAGKVYFIERGAFNNVDVAMMVHPARKNVLFLPMKACKNITATFEGRSSHASSSPWLARNALDAAVNTYTSVGLLRQQIHPSHRIGVVISEGGNVPNVIPSKAVMKFGARATTMKEMDGLLGKIKFCCKSGAAASGCNVKFTEDEEAYDSILFNTPLGLRFQRHAGKLGARFVEHLDVEETGSTDMGNVSQIVPSIHPVYSIGEVSNHSKEFAEAAKTEEAHTATLQVAEAMALTCVDILRDANLLKEIKEDFLQKKLNS